MSKVYGQEARNLRFVQNVYGDDFQSAYEQLVNTIYELASNYRYLLDNKNGKMDEFEIREIEVLLDRDYLLDLKNRVCVMDSLKSMTWLLHRYHGVKPIVLIDDYDVPFAKAIVNGYDDKMTHIVYAMLDSALKTNWDLGRAVMTARLLATKGDAISGGLNHLHICNVMSDSHDDISAGIGFTKEDTELVLKHFNLEKYSDLVWENYGGNYFGRVQMFSPWDVMNFCRDNCQNADKSDKEIIAANYRKGLCGNNLVEEYMEYIQRGHLEQMQSLMDGKSILSEERLGLWYNDLIHHDIDDFWMLLVHFGYLTYNHKSVGDSKSIYGWDMYEMNIPNKEMKSCFREEILSFYEHDDATQKYMADSVKGLFSGDAEMVADNINGVLAKYVYVRDVPKENMYHALIHYLLDNRATIIYEHNASMEPDKGYVDIVAKSNVGNAIVILEIRQILSDWLSRTIKAQESVNQIKKSDLMEKFLSNSENLIVGVYGICFCKNVCSVVFEKIN